MFAIIETLGRQYKVSVGDKIKVDRIAEAQPGQPRTDAPENTKITFNQVLFVGTDDGSTAKVGTPCLNGATVVGRVVEQGKDKKGVAFKKKRRKGYTRKVGFRRAFTTVEIQEIKAA